MPIILQACTFKSPLPVSWIWPPATGSRHKETSYLTVNNCGLAGWFCTYASQSLVSPHLHLPAILQWMACSVPQKADFMHSLTSVFRLSFTNQRHQKEMRGKDKRSGYSFYTPSAMVWMFVFLEIHMLKCSCPMWWYQEMGSLLTRVEPPMSGICAHIKETPGSSLSPSPTQGHIQKEVCNTGESHHLTTLAPWS